MFTPQHRKNDLNTALGEEREENNKLHIFWYLNIIV